MPITRETDGALKLGGTGQPVEWAVEMERFNEDNTLDHLAERGLIDMRLANALGVAVAAAHRAAPVIYAASRISAVQIFIEQNDVANAAIAWLNWVQVLKKSSRIGN